MTDKTRQRVPSHTSFIYFLAFVGAFIYYIQQATGFWMGVTGFFKALIWPAILTYKLMDYLQM